MDRIKKFDKTLLSLFAPLFEGEGETLEDILGQEYYLDDEIDGVYYDKPNTTVKWKDGDVTTVTCREIDKYDEYTGLVYCIVKHYLGNDTKLFHRELKHQVENAVRQSVPENNEAGSEELILS